MSTLQVSNLHFESTGNNRLQYTGSNAYNLVAGGTTVATVNTTAVNFPLSLGLNTVTANTLTINTVTANTLAVNTTISANGSVGTAGQTLFSGGAGVNTYWGTAGGNYVMQSYTTTGSNTWTKPANLKAIKVTVVAGGGGGGVPTVSPGPTGSVPTTGGAGGGGSSTFNYFPAENPAFLSPVTVTVGSGGAAGPSPNRTGGTSSFGALISCTGGLGSFSGAGGGTGTATGGAIVNVSGSGSPGPLIAAGGGTLLAMFNSTGVGAGGTTSTSGSNGAVIIEEYY